MASLHEHFPGRVEVHTGLGQRELPMGEMCESLSKGQTHSFECKTLAPSLQSGLPYAHGPWGWGRGSVPGAGRGATDSWHHLKP